MSRTATGRQQFFGGGFKNPLDKPGIEVKRLQYCFELVCQMQVPFFLVTRHPPPSLGGGGPKKKGSEVGLEGPLRRQLSQLCWEVWHKAPWVIFFLKNA